MCGIYLIAGCVAFIGAAAWFLTRPSTLVQLEDKIVFGTYFVGAVACLGLSFAFHTVQCHSVGVGKLFSKFVLRYHFTYKIWNNYSIGVGLCESRFRPEKGRQWLL